MCPIGRRLPPWTTNGRFQRGDCGVPLGIGVLVGAVFAAGGMAIVAVLVMRALGEWREVEDRERAGHAPR